MKPIEDADATDFPSPVPSPLREKQESDAATPPLERSKSTVQREARAKRPMPKMSVSAHGP